MDDLVACEAHPTCAGAVDAKRYARILLLMSKASTPEQLNDITMLFIFDLSFAREDIGLALNTVERAKGWRA